MASGPRALRSLTTQDWRFLAADAGGWSPQTASISSSALTGCPSRVARACSTTRSWGPRRPEPSTVSRTENFDAHLDQRPRAEKTRQRDVYPGIPPAGPQVPGVGTDTSRVARPRSPGAPHEPLQPLLRLRSLVVPHRDRRHDRRSSRHRHLRRSRDRCPGHSGRGPSTTPPFPAAQGPRPHRSTVLPGPAGMEHPGGWEQPVCSTELRRGAEGPALGTRRPAPDYLP